VSARSALTEGSDRDSFCSHSPKVQLGTGAVQGVRRPSEVQGCEPEREIEGLLLQVCAESSDFNT
jgi:hypothetical protein